MREKLSGVGLAPFPSSALQLVLSFIRALSMSDDPLLAGFAYQVRAAAGTARQSTPLVNPLGSADSFLEVESPFHGPLKWSAHMNVTSGRSDV